jgi:hypothetical protein
MPLPRFEHVTIRTEIRCITLRASCYGNRKTVFIASGAPELNAATRNSSKSYLTPRDVLSRFCTSITHFRKPELDQPFA